MAWGKQASYDIDEADKASYNTSASIVGTISDLHRTYMTSKLYQDFHTGLIAITCLIDTVYPKLNEKEVKEINEKVEAVEDILADATATYYKNNVKFFKDENKRKIIKIKIQDLWREVWRLCDSYGYGMKNADDPGLAVKR